MNVDERVGHRIRYFRTEKAMSQVELGRALGGLSQSAIQRIETGKTKLDLARILRLVQVLSVDLDDLMSLDIRTRPMDHAMHLDYERFFQGATTATEVVAAK